MVELRVLNAGLQERIQSQSPRGTKTTCRRLEGKKLELQPEKRPRVFDGKGMLAVEGQAGRGVGHAGRALHNEHLHFLHHKQWMSSQLLQWATGFQGLGPMRRMLLGGRRLCRLEHVQHVLLKRFAPQATMFQAREQPVCTGPWQGSMHHSGGMSPEFERLAALISDLGEQDKIFAFVAGIKKHNAKMVQMCLL